MAVLLHKWEFKNIEVECLKVSEKTWSPQLPDIGARKSWDFLILTVTASTVDPDQTAPLGQSSLGLHCMYYAILPDTLVYVVLGHLTYT